MAREFQTLDQLMAEDEAKRRAEAIAEIAAEKAAWDALPEDEKARQIEAREAKWAAFEEAAERALAEESGEDEDEDEGPADRECEWCGSTDHYTRDCTEQD